MEPNSPQDRSPGTTGRLDESAAASGPGVVVRSAAPSAFPFPQNETDDAGRRAWLWQQRTQASNTLESHAKGEHYFFPGAMAAGTAVLAAASLIAPPVVVGATIGAVAVGSVVGALSMLKESGLGFATTLGTGLGCVGIMAGIATLSPGAVAAVIVGSMAVGTLKTFKTVNDNKDKRLQEVVEARRILATAPPKIDVASWQALRAKGAHSDKSQVSPPRTVRRT